MLVAHVRGSLLQSLCAGRRAVLRPAAQGPGIVDCSGESACCVASTIGSGGHG